MPNSVYSGSPGAAMLKIRVVSRRAETLLKVAQNREEEEDTHGKTGASSRLELKSLLRQRP